MLKSEKKLGEILLEEGLITEQELKSSLKEQAVTKEFLGKILIRKNLIKEKDLLTALAKQFNLSVVSLKNKYIDWQIAKDFSSSLIFDYRCLPIQKDNNSVTMAINNPLDIKVIKKAEEEAKGLNLKWVLVAQEDLEDAILRYQKYLRGQILKLFK